MAALHNTIRARRERLGLSQQALADRVGVSRQAIVAIEGGKQVPSTTLALQLAATLGCAVEALFSVAPPDGLSVVVAATGRADESPRVALGRVQGRWVAHPVAADATVAADGLISGELARPLEDPAHLERNVLVAGCAPLLGAVAQRVARRTADARVRWLPASSKRALELLKAGLVHVAGLHDAGEAHAAIVRRMFSGQRMLLVNLTVWRQGFVVAQGNPLGISGAGDLLLPGLKMARREAGAGAAKLVAGLLAGAGAAGLALAGPLASGHEDVAHLVRCGAADVGVAIESVALNAGLSFVPISEERFDLIVPAATAEATPVRRLLEALDEPGFKAEARYLPGYDCAWSGEVTTLEVAA